VPSATPGPGALIAFIRIMDKTGAKCYDPNPTCPVSRVWIVGTDGNGARELVQDGVEPQSGLAWSPDGIRLMYSQYPNLYLSDANGSTPEQLNTGCVAPCTADLNATFSNDGTMIVFVRAYRDASGYDGPSTITTMDLASGRVVQLTSTAPAGGMSPTWSPDGTQIAFWRPGDKDMGGPIAPVKSAVFVVDADGQNLRQVSPSTIAAGAVTWSPDGSRLVFASTDDLPDIYTIRPDGTDLRRLTTDGISTRATWTPDGRVLFVRGLGAGATAGSAGNTDAPAFWTMAADGTDAARLMTGILHGDEDPMWTQGPVWQPVGGSAIVPPPWNASTATSAGPPPPTPSPTPAPALAAGFSWTGSLHPTEDTSTSDTATLLADGRVLVTMSCSTTAELYDPATGTFSATASMITATGGGTATLLRDGRVLFAGGADCVDQGPETIPANELYDPATGTFSAIGPLHAPRSRHTATLLADGRVLVTGGMPVQTGAGSTSIVLAAFHTADTGTNMLTSAELYDPATGTFSQTGSMRYFRDRHTATLLQDGRVLVVGGGGEGYASRTQVELYDPTSGTFSRTGSLKHGRWLHTATLLQDGRVLIAGGRSPKDSTYASAELYDPTTGTFSSAGSMQAGRQGHTATLLQDGRVLIAGGYWSDGQRWDVLSSTALFDPSTGTFSSAGSMGEARMEQIATLLDGGQVLIAGGSSFSATGIGPTTSAVLYQP
jgi:WD40 repeat protein